MIAQATRTFTNGVAAYDRGECAMTQEVWRPLAHSGYPAAQRTLAHLFRVGLGVAQNFAQAVPSYRMAAESGLAGAQANLAIVYLRGQGVEGGRLVLPSGEGQS